MDLFGFAKDVGRRLFNTEDEAVGKIKDLIESNNPGVADLGVEFDNGIVTLSGHCQSPAARQKCALMAGNVQGVADVYVNNMTVEPAPEPAAAAVATPEAAEADEDEAQIYVIKSGDTLGKIAKEFYGKAGAYMKIFEANREIIDDPDKIYVGQTIRIPK